MSDREMLLMAAKAAGIGPVLCYEKSRNCLHIGDRNSYKLWRPFSDSDDALRLASVLLIGIEYSKGGRIYAAPPGEAPFFEEFGNQWDEITATRRVIVRAAADIGEAMP